MVGLRDRQKAVGETWDQCRSGLVRMKVPVQRLVMVLPMVEQLPRESQEKQASDSSVRGPVDEHLPLPLDEAPQEDGEVTGEEPAGHETEHDLLAPAPMPQREASARCRRRGAVGTAPLRVQVSVDAPQVKDL